MNKFLTSTSPMVPQYLQGFSRCLKSTRGFHASAWVANAPPLRPSPRNTMNKDPKAISRREAKRKELHKEPPQNHPLYMDISTAMKYMRAAEVGHPPKKTTVSLQLTILPEKGAAPLQGLVKLPRPIKDNYPLIFTQDPEQLAQLQALNRACKVGGTELIEEIQRGLSLNGFTQAFATPEMVPLLKPVARVLGTNGLMPSAKRGTVSESVILLVEDAAGSVSFRQRAFNLAIPVGRCDFSDEEIIRNIKAVSDVVYSLQAPGTKKRNTIGRCNLSSTLGPSVIIDIRR